MPRKAVGPQRTANRTTVEIHLGSAGISVGELVFTQQGRREIAQFAYADSWLAATDNFEVSPDLSLAPGYIARRAPSPVDSVFPLALGDTAPDAWGRRVIERAHAHRRRRDAQLPPLTELDFLCAVDDFSRMGALRLCRDGDCLGSAQEGRRHTPPLLELESMYRASRAIEDRVETAEDLRYLQGKGTSLGGMRPKCTFIDDDGRLSLGKFPSVGDTYDVTRAEVLALHLARRAGIDAAPARVAMIGSTPVAVIARFDRTDADERIPYLSAASMLQASPQDDHAYDEIVEAIQRHSPTPIEDARQLWRRLLFGLLITNVDDHLQNHGFLYAGARQWALSPAFDLNPMPGKLRESKTLLTAAVGPIDSVRMLLDDAAIFRLAPGQALNVLAEVLEAVEGWKAVAASTAIGLSRADIDHLQPAFEHEATDEARLALGRPAKGG